MFHIVLYEPEIPPNTGNIIRLCANTGTQLHLIQPLGFDLNDKQLRRAGLDYHEWANVKVYDDFVDFKKQSNPNRLFACTTKATHLYTEIKFQKNDTFLFGPETRGLPMDVLNAFKPQYKLRLPMLETSRSLNLSNSVAIVLYEAWRQNDFFQGI